LSRGDTTEASIHAGLKALLQSIEAEQGIRVCELRVEWLRHDEVGKPAHFTISDVKVTTASSS
jgi:hypothetical protein